MQLVEMDLSPLPCVPIEARILLVSLLEKQLADCALGWALVLDIRVTPLLPNFFPGRHACLLGACLQLQNVVLSLKVGPAQPVDFPAWAVEGAVCSHARYVSAAG